MKKTIGVTCDDYKAEKYRKRLLEKGFEIVFDSRMTNTKNVHLFKIECKEEDFAETKAKLQKVLIQLDIEQKQSN